MQLRSFLALSTAVLLLTGSGTKASAEEAKMNALQTALSSTTISGYVDTSIEWSLDQPSVAQPAPTHQSFGNWWRVFRLWLRTQGWHR